MIRSDTLPARASALGFGRATRVAAACSMALTAVMACVEQVELTPVTPDPLEASGSAGAAAPDAGGGGDIEAPGTSGNGGGFDVTPENPPEAGCAKVDFLFVVDNSISMFQHQENLSRSFPRFMQVVEDKLEANDFHIMVVDTDGWDGDDTEEGDADPCRNELGAGKRSGAIGQDCGVDGSTRYLQGGQTSLSDTFSCIAQVGTFGDNGEQPMDAMLQATSSAKNNIGGCNEGFLRDDAILVVTFITDEDDESSSGSPDTWRQALLDAKGNDPDALVVLGLVGDDNLDEPLPGGPCDFFFSASGAPALQSFVNSFEHGSLASVCADDYGVFFEAAVMNIDTACDQFVPPVIQ